MATTLVDVARMLILGVGDVVLWFFLLLNGATALLLIGATVELWRHWHIADDAELAPVLRAEALPPVSVLVTGSDAHPVSVDRVHSLLALEYPRHEVVLVHDGAMDDAMHELMEAFALYQVPPAVMVSVPTGPVRGYYRSRWFGKLFVIDKQQTEVGDSINAALNASRFPYVLVLDAGTSLARDGLLRLMRPFLLGERVAAVTATSRVAAASPAAPEGFTEPHVPTGWLAGVQAAERLRDAFSRLAWTRLGGRLDTHGRVVLHRREHLLEIDGYRTDVTDEELDLAVRLRRHLREQRLPEGMRIIPDPVAWTIGADSAPAVARERARWQRGRGEALLSHRGLLFNPRAGALGLVALPHLLVTTVIAPALEATGYLLVLLALLVRGSALTYVAAFLLVTLGYGMLLSAWAIALERLSPDQAPRAHHSLRLAAFAVLEQVGFRQVALWTRLRGVRRALGGGHSGTDVPLAGAARPAKLSSGAGGGARAR
jgi:cellulose synthase/poly-beta-1,6-N-acetylglucosamine synthase-like glycosyltransferase